MSITKRCSGSPCGLVSYGHGGMEAVTAQAGRQGVPDTGGEGDINHSLWTYSPPVPGAPIPGPPTPSPVPSPVYGPVLSPASSGGVCLSQAPALARSQSAYSFCPKRCRARQGESR